MGTSGRFSMSIGMSFCGAGVGGGGGECGNGEREGDGDGDGDGLSTTILVSMSSSWSPEVSSRGDTVDGCTYVRCFVSYLNHDGHTRSGNSGESLAASCKSSGKLHLRI